MANTIGNGLDLTDLDDRAIQKMLREVDTSDLAVALYDGTDEVKDRVFRNMSKRAQELLKEEIKYLGTTESGPGVEKINVVIEKLIEQGEIIRGKPTPTKKKKDIMAVEVDTNSAESLRESLVALAEKARSSGLLSLEDDLESVEDPYFRMGLQLVVDGTDPEIVKSVLYTELDSQKKKKQMEIKETVLRLEKELAATVVKKKKIIEGVLSIQSGDNPRIVEQKIKAFEV